MNDRLMSPQEVADYLGVSVQTIYNWRHRGEGPVGFRVGGQVRYRASDVDAWLNQHADRPTVGATDDAA